MRWGWVFFSVNETFECTLPNSLPWLLFLYSAHHVPMVALSDSNYSKLRLWVSWVNSWDWLKMTWIIIYTYNESCIALSTLTVLFLLLSNRRSYIGLNWAVRVVRMCGKRLTKRWILRILSNNTEINAIAIAEIQTMKNKKDDESDDDNNQFPWNCITSVIWPPHRLCY